jgi:hypothetical protein
MDNVITPTIGPADAADLEKNVAAWSTAAGAPQRREKDRRPINCEIHVTPVDDFRKLLHDESIRAIGKDISTSGIAFSHLEPLSHRLAVPSLKHAKAGQLTVEAEVVWSKKIANGLYESGCRLIRKWPHPL